MNSESIDDIPFVSSPPFSEGRDEYEAQIAELKAALEDRERQITELRRAITEIYRSTSWRLTTPVRVAGGGLVRKKRDVQLLWTKAGDTYRVAQDFLDNELSLTRLKRLFQVVLEEGFEGIKSRVGTRHRALQSVTQARAGLSAAEDQGACSITRDPSGHYMLTARATEYTYVEPQRPLDIDARIAQLAFVPFFSIIVPVYSTTPELLEAALGSVTSQWYPHWQLILVDDASPSEETRLLLNGINHPQVRVWRLARNQGIAGATNAGLEVADGDYVVFLDHGDELTVDCLYELALCIAQERPDYIYSDEDKLSELGLFTEPHFKPDWSPDTMMSTMYTCHVSCVRRDLVNAVGGLRPEFDGCQDWDLVLRITEITARISHVPKVLYHWRINPASTASDIAATPYASAASQHVRLDALARRGLSGRVEPILQVPGYFRVAYDLMGYPLISIIIPTRDNEKVLRRCIESIHDLTRYRKFEIIILDNGSVTPDAVAYLQQLGKQSGVTVIRYDAPFNFSELNNIGARAAIGELLVFLNDDTEVLQDDWLERLGGYAQLPHVGPVGAKLLYPGGEVVQHAGVLNLEGGPHHAFLNRHRDDPCYFMRNLLEYNWLAVTGACLMVERTKFDMVSGFAESLPVAYNDIDLCLRLRDAGYFGVVVQAVSLIHHESASRGMDDCDPTKAARLARDRAHMYERNPRYFQYDPFHNPNLHPNGLNFEVSA